MIDSPRLSDLVATITSLPFQTQEVVGTLMQEVADLGPEDSIDSGDSNMDARYDSDQHHSRSNFSPPPDARTNHGLQLEEQYAKIMSQLERRNGEYQDLEREIQAMSDSLARSQETNDALNDQIVEKDDQLKKQRSVNNDREQSTLRELESKISQQEEVIASHEIQLAKSHTHVTELQRENRKLNSSSEKIQKLEDELDVMKADLERQTRKANTADKYMQKLQSSQSIEKERDSLRQEVGDMRTRLLGADKLRHENLALQKSNDESSRTLSQIEQEHEELRMTKKQLRMNYDSLTHQVDALNERFAQDQETIADLKDRHVGSESQASPSMANGGLEGELAETSKHEEQMQVVYALMTWMRTLTSNRKSRIVELEKENQRLLSDANSKEAESQVAKRQLENAQDSSADQYAQTQRLRQEILSLQTSLGQVRQGHPIEGSVHPQRKNMGRTHNYYSTETFRKMRDQVKAEAKRSAGLEEELLIANKNLEMARNDRMLSSESHYMMTSLNIDLLEESLIDKPKLEMVKEVTQQTAAALIELESEHQALQKRHQRQQEDFDKRTEAQCVVSRDEPQLQGEVNVAMGDLNNSELRDLIQQASSGMSVDSVSDAIVTKIENGRERLAKQQKVEEQISFSEAAFETVRLAQEIKITAPPTPSRLQRVSKKILIKANKR